MTIINYSIGEIVLNILNATAVFDDKYTDVVNRIQYIETCATGCIFLQLANYVSQFMYFVLTTIQTMNLDRKQAKKKNKIIQEEQSRIDDGATDTWL